MRDIRLGTAALLLLLPALVSAADEVRKAREKLARAGILFTVDAFLGSARRGDRQAVDLFVKAGMPVNSRNERGETALLIAAEADDAAVGSLLLRAGADVDARSYEGETPLSRSVRSGRDSRGRAVRAALLAAGADVTLRYGDGGTVLHAAAESANPDAMRALIAAGAEVDARTDGGETPLYQCACTGRLAEMQVLIAAGADVNARGRDGATPLVSAAACGEGAAVSVLLQAKADARASDRNGRTALMSVAQFNVHFVETGRVAGETLTQIVRELIAAGGDPDAARRYDGVRPLMEAAGKGNLPVVRALLAGGASINARDRDGKTALDHAQERPEVATVLKAAGALASPARQR